jgi:hypothetical protein
MDYRRIELAAGTKVDAWAGWVDDYLMIRLRRDSGGSVDSALKSVDYRWIPASCTVHRVGRVRGQVAVDFEV